jgi:hypothetical protein
MGRNGILKKEGTEIKVQKGKRKGGQEVRDEDI